MSRTLPPLTCDECGCDITPVVVCACSRCRVESPETEQFHSCEEHKSLVEQKHARIRGEHHEVSWSKLPGALPSGPPASRYIEAGELFQRARDCLAGKSRSYVVDARLFARAVLLIEKGVDEGAIEIHVEREP